MNSTTVSSKSSSTFYILLHFRLLKLPLKAILFWNIQSTTKLWIFFIREETAFTMSISWDKTWIRTIRFTEAHRIPKSLFADKCSVESVKKKKKVPGISLNLSNQVTNHEGHLPGLWEVKGSVGWSNGFFCRTRCKSQLSNLGRRTCGCSLPFL